MDDFELRVMVAALVASRGGHTVAGAVALAGEIIAEVKAQHPEIAAASDRRRVTQAWRRRLRDG